MKPSIFSSGVSWRGLLLTTVNPCLLPVLFLAPCLGATDFVPGRILVKPRAQVPAEQIRALYAGHGAEKADEIPQIGLHILKVPEVHQGQVIEALRHHPNIEFAESDDLLPAAALPNDTYYSSEWHLPIIQAPQAWDLTTGSSSVIIAILDSGCDPTHPELVSQFVPGWNFYDNNADTSDANGHGTAVAGVAAAASNNLLGVASVAGNCRIMPVRVANSYAVSTTSAMANGLAFAADQGARVANISYDVSSSLTISSAAQYFQTKGGVVVVSAGNTGSVLADPDNVYMLTVSATDSHDTVASWSTTGSHIDLAAPGTSILTTARGGLYASGTGTSFSAPIVAGVAALVLSANSQLTGARVQQILKQSADDLGAPGWDSYYGYGRINAYKAVLAATAQNPAPDLTPPGVVITAPAQSSTVSGTVAIRVNAIDDAAVTKVECYVGGSLLGCSSVLPASFSWDTVGLPNGSYTILARAYDAANNATSTSSTVPVSNLPPDTAPPSVQVTSPSSGATVSGTVSIGTTTADDTGVVKVDLSVNGAWSATSTNSNPQFSWNTSALASGSYTLQAKAFDAAGNSGSSLPVTVTVQNKDIIPPTVQITSPSDGAVISKTCQITVAASDNASVAQVVLYIDGKLFSTSPAAPVIFTWNSTKATKGKHTLQAVATDASGNAAASAIVTVTK
jgi:thermitase